MMVYIATMICVTGIALGQLLFKWGALAVSNSGTLWAYKPFTILFSAMCLYCCTSYLWVWILQRIELGRIYPLMALAFVIVPLASYYAFGEKFSNQYFLGVLFIVLGVVLATTSAKL